MKAILPLLLASLMIYPLISLGQNDYNYDKVEKFSKKRTTGLVLSGIGSGFIVGGVALAATAKWSYSSSGGRSNYNSSDPQALVGMLMVVAGIPMMIVGIVKAVRGKKWVNHYSYSLIMHQTPVGSTIGLAYRFWVLYL